MFFFKFKGNNMTKNILLGAQLSISGGFWQALVRAHSIGANCIQIFTKSNRQWAAKKIEDSDIEKFISHQKELGIKVVVAHASYLINLGSEKKDVQEKSIKALADEIERCEKLSIPYLVLHPGSNPSKDTSHTCLQIAHNINKAFAINKPRHTMVLLETMAGQGSTVGNSFENLAEIIRHVTDKKHIGVCIDTCHIYAAGYKFEDEKSYKMLWEKFDEIIGIEKIKAIHMNDSKKELGSHVDRHEDIGKGKINISAFKLIMNDKKFKNIPKIIETPKSAQDLKDDTKNLNLLRSFVKK
jgi:deoxyribonuclease IV